MTRLSRTAQGQIVSLSNHFRQRGRLEAVENLRMALARASKRIEAFEGPFFPAPRPYPHLARPEWHWLKQGPYWFAFVSHGQESVIQVVFHQAADIPGRL